MFFVSYTVSSSTRLLQRLYVITVISHWHSPLLHRLQRLPCAVFREEEEEERGSECRLHHCGSYCNKVESETCERAWRDMPLYTCESAVPGV